MTANGLEPTICLIFDEMAIRKQSIFDPVAKEFQGHITAGRPNEHEICAPLARESLVLMVSGIELDFKVPIGYFFINGLCAEEKAAIMNEALYILSQIGAIVSSLVFDGYRANITTMKILGVDYKNDRPYFMNPFDGLKKVYVILDACHMLKLMRNCLGNKKIIYAQNDEISWHFFEDLFELQSTQHIKLANKLTKTHIDYSPKKMSVRIAAETLSESVAQAMAYLSSIRYKDFEKSKPTQDYCLMANNLFDIMNSKRKHDGQKFKKPISKETETEFSAFFEKARNYLSKLKIIEDGIKKQALRTKSFTPFFGFYYNTISLMGIYNDYVKNSTGIFYTFSVSQDHLESYFGCIRSMGGYNDNPNAQLFQAAYRKLLLHTEVASSHHSNCENDITKILTVSSKNCKEKNLSQKSRELEALGEDENYDLQNCESLEGNEDNLLNNSYAYLASIVEMNVVRKLSNRKSNSCETCLNIFIENKLYDDSFIDFIGNKSIYPCKSTVDIMKKTDFFLNNLKTQNISLDATISYILCNIDYSETYSKSFFPTSSHDSHKTDLIQLVISTYLDLKSIETARNVTRDSQKKQLRHHLLKKVHFSGQ